MKQSRKDKKESDKFSISVIGAIIYSVILIMVMGGSYIAVKVIIKNYDAKQAVIAANEEAAKETSVEEEEVDETVDDTIVEEEEEEVAEVKEEEHLEDVSNILDKETGVVDYSNILFEPAKRDNKLTWNDSVFSRIEDVKNPHGSAVNSFAIKSVNVNLSDNKEAEYRAFINPENNYIEKITETVNCGSNREVVDYYYSNGSINYVAQYNMVIDKPVCLSSAEIESRYYFTNDVMVRYIFCGDGKAIEYCVGDLDTYSEGTVGQYDYLEDQMINRAYIVYNLAKSLNETEVLYGYVLDEFSVPLEDADIKVTSEKDGSIVASTTTDGDGFYKVSIKCDETDKFTVTANKDQLNGVSVYGITSIPGAYRYAVDPVYLNYLSNGGVYNVQIMVRDALDTAKCLSGATIKLRRGINDTEGEVIATGTLDDTGSAIVPMYAGSYTAEVSKGGYETSIFTVIVRVDHQSEVGFAIPDVGENKICAVLSWESTPLDLDFKAISSGQGTVSKSSIDSIGATTAEVITLDSVDQDIYRFYVSDFGSISVGDAMSYNMTNSGATVKVYSAEGQIASYHVPVASAGIVWEPFMIHNGQALPMNNYYYDIEDSPLWNQK